MVTNTHFKAEKTGAKKSISRVCCGYLAIIMDVEMFSKKSRTMAKSGVRLMIWNGLALDKVRWDSQLIPINRKKV